MDQRVLLPGADVISVDVSKRNNSCEIRIFFIINNVYVGHVIIK